MRIDRFYTLIGLFVGGGLILILISCFFMYDIYIRKKENNYVMFFNGSLKGLDTTSMVTYRGFKIGEVKTIELVQNELEQRVKIPVYVEFFVEKSLTSKKNPINLLIQHGYEAKISSPNLLSGNASINLVKVHSSEEKIGSYGTYRGYPIFPTIKGSGHYISLNKTLRAAKKTLDEIRTFVLKLKVQDTLAATQSMSQSVDKLAKTLDQELPMVLDTMDRSLTHVSNAANSMQNLTDYLAQNPESIVRGRQ